jgi:hypothetical protein
MWYFGTESSSSATENFPASAVAEISKQKIGKTPFERWKSLFFKKWDTMDILFNKLL